MLDAVGVGFELVAAAPVIVGRQDHGDAVVVTQSQRAVPQRAGGDLIGLAVPEAPADIQRIVVVEKVDFGAFGRLVALDRLRLLEIVDHRREGPHRIVQHSVDDWRRGGTYHADLLQPDRIVRRLLRRTHTRRRAKSQPAQPAHVRRKSAEA